MSTKQKHKILLVDDEIAIINAIFRVIDRKRYDVEYTTEPEKALEILEKGDVDVLICDQRMPRISGIEVINFAKNISPVTVRILMTGYSDINVTIMAINEGKIFYYIAKPWNNRDLVNKIDEAILWKKEQEKKEVILRNFQLNKHYWTKIVSDLTDKLVENTQKSVNSLLKIIKVRDMELYLHSKNATRYALMLADAIGLKGKRRKDLEYASLVHDIGKIAVRDRIVYKPESLDTDEFGEMKKHSDIGAEIVEELGYSGDMSEIIRQHHEWIDGTGYPKGLTGDKILLEAKILAVADAFDALTSDRIYRKGMSGAEALEIMEGESGAHFDPYILNVFSRRLKNE